MFLVILLLVAIIVYQAIVLRRTKIAYNRQAKLAKSAAYLAANRRIVENRCIWNGVNRD